MRYRSRVKSNTKSADLLVGLGLSVIGYFILNLLGFGRKQ